MAEEKALLDELLEDHTEMRQERMTFESYWEEIADILLPSMRSRLRPDMFVTPGTKETDQQLDATPQIALERFKAILDSLLTPQNSVWHRIRTEDEDDHKDRETALWLEEVNRRMWNLRRAPSANYVSQNIMTWESLGAFGTGILFTDELKSHTNERGIRYRHIPIGEGFIRENHQGIVDTVHREFSLTARQAKQQFGEDALSDQTKQKFNSGKGQKAKFLHCVKPRTDYNPRFVDFAGMPFASYYIDLEGKTFIREEGYRSFPYSIARYVQYPGEVYGRSPAMMVLGAMKTLQVEKKIILKQGHRAVDPVMFTNDDGIVDTVNMTPGSMNAGGVNEQGRPLVWALPSGNVALGKEMMDDERAVINDAFLVALFQIITEPRGSTPPTAAEVLERTREKGILLAPTVGRQQSEYLGPTVHRDFDLMAQMRMLPPMPTSLQRKNYRIEYDNPMSRAQRAEEAAGLIRTVDTTLQVVGITKDPEPLDHFDWDTIIPAVADINAVPKKWLRDPRIIAQMRDQRAQQAAQQAQVEAAPAAASLIAAGAKAQKAG